MSLFPAHYPPCSTLTLSTTSFRYRHGLGVPQSVTEAVRLYQLAAAENLPCAQFNLGFMFQMGLGVQQDIPKAICLYKLAAEQGDEDALRSIEHVNAFIPFIRTYSATLPHYLAISHVLATRALRRRLPLHARMASLCAPAPSQPLAARAAVEVPHAARIRVCSSGWASLLSTRLAQGPHYCNVVYCSVACLSIAARVLGRRCSVLQVIFLASLVGIRRCQHRAFATL